MITSEKEMDKSKNLFDSGMTVTNKSLVPLTKAHRFSSKQVRNKWCKQLLYKLHIIHTEFADAQCNVCLENLKVDENNDLVLTNVSENSTNDAEKVTDVKYKAPELLRCNEHSKAGDVWATGICIYFIINSTFSWKIAVENDCDFSLWKTEGKFSSTVDSSLTRILEQMLCVKPDMRADTREILKMLWDRERVSEILGELVFCYLEAFVKITADLFKAM